MKSSPLITYLLINILTLLTATRQLYLSVPYQTIRNQSAVKHLVNIEINRLPYLIDFTLLSQKDQILNLQDAALYKTMVDRPDYRKNQQSVFGIFQFLGTEHADQRMEFKRKTFYNLYYFIRDYQQKTAWVSLNTVNQVSTKGWAGDGAFNFGPGNIDSQVLKDLKRYSKFMEKPIVTFRGNKRDQNGDIIFGEIPPSLTENGIIYTTGLDYLGEQFWTMSSASLQLQRKNGKNIASVDIYREMVKLRLTISERTLILPEIAVETIRKAIPRCSYLNLPKGDERNKYLACKDVEDLSYLALNFTLRDSDAPLSILMRDQVKLQEGNTHWFDIVAGEPDQFQIGESILRQYMIGINYREGKLHYSPLNKQSWLTKALFMKIFLFANLILFLISLTIVIFEERVKEMVKVAVKQEFQCGDKNKPGKVNSYELANVSEESFAE